VTVLHQVVREVVNKWMLIYHFLNNNDVKI